MVVKPQVYYPMFVVVKLTPKLTKVLYSVKRNFQKRHALTWFGLRCLEKGGLDKDLNCKEGDNMIDHKTNINALKGTKCVLYNYLHPFKELA